jgi:hypothetical protein
MAFDLSIAGVDIPTDAVAYQSFPNDIEMAFNLDSTLSSLLDVTLANVPSSAATSTVTYTSPSASWSPGGGVVQFGLQGGVTGTLAVVTSGTLLSYTDGLDSPQTVNVPVPQNTAYLSLTLKFNISANVATNYSGGEWGVKAAASTADSYSITFSKTFAPNTTVRVALPQVFKGFVLPLHPQTLAQMSPNDYLLHEFNGNLQLSFGAYFGLDQVLYAGQSSADVIQTLGSPLATLSAQTKPEIELGINLNFQYGYTCLFEALLSKINGAAGLQLYRSKNATTSTTLTAGLTFNANTQASITSHAQTIQDSVVNAAGGAGSPAGVAVGQVLTSATTEINKYVTEVNDKLSSWLNRGNGIQANLEVAIQTAGTRTILAGYDFDLTSNPAAAAQAWQSAINGDFVAAFQTGAVTLDAGSGMEQEYQRKTSFSCNFFNLWSMSTWSQFSSKVSMVYAGNNIFQLQANVGRTIETTSVGAMHSIDIYFTASADTKAGGQISNPEIDLHIDLMAQSDQTAIGVIATILSAIEAGPTGDALARSMHAFAATAKQNNGIAQLQVTIPASAYSNLNCDQYSNGKPLTTSTYNDALNWNAFAQAADDLQAWPLPTLISGGDLPYMESFKAWQALNLTMNDAINRLNTFYPIGTWPSSFPNLDSGSQALVIYSLTAGQNFMNFCGDLCSLIASSSVTSAGTNWNALIDQLTNAIKNDLNVDFARPTALATIRLCKSPSMTVSGPSVAAVPDAHFAVTVQL